MSAVQLKQARRTRRRRRVRSKIAGTAERPRVSVYRSNRGISAQVIDDVAGKTVASVNWTEADLRKLSGVEQAKQAGQALADRAKQAGVEVVVFDRNGFLYHGRVQAFADGLREGGLTV